MAVITLENVMDKLSEIRDAIEGMKKAPVPEAPAQSDYDNAVIHP